MAWAAGLSGLNGMMAQNRAMTGEQSFCIRPPGSDMGAGKISHANSENQISIAVNRTHQSGWLTCFGPAKNQIFREKSSPPTSNCSRFIRFTAYF